MVERVLRARLGDYDAVLVMRRYIPETDGGLWYGGSESPPQWVVKHVEVRYQGKRVPLGRGTYSDLAEVLSMLFYKNCKGEMVLKLEGGDAADSYRAYLVFQRGEIVRRRVESTAFPNNFYEETRYVNIPVRD
jgi:hypothetical protein